MFYINVTTLLVVKCTGSSRSSRMTVAQVIRFINLPSTHMFSPTEMQLWTTKQMQTKWQTHWLWWQSVKQTSWISCWNTSAE